MRHALAVEPQLSAIAPARRWAGEKLAEAGIEGHTFDVLILLVSEVVTNAVAHASPPVSLHLEIKDDLARVEVYDCAREVPIVKHPEPSDIGGRGVSLVDQLATRWGIETFENSDVIKLVWFELALSGERA